MVKPWTYLPWEEDKQKQPLCTKQTKHGKRCSIPAAGFFNDNPGTVMCTNHRRVEERNTA